jgi:hypothetical protein
MAVSCLKRVVAGVLQLRVGLEPRLAHVGFVGDDVFLLVIAHIFITVFKVFAD